jgi:anti-sigma B factor antagonist
MTSAAIQEDLRGPVVIVKVRCPPFEVRLVEQGSAGCPAVVCVSGEVDYATAPEMQGVLLHLLHSGTTHVVVDMAPVSFIDCFGLGVLVGVANAARAVGGGLALRSPSRQLRRVRDLVGLEELLPTEADARARAKIAMPKPTTPEWRGLTLLDDLADAPNGYRPLNGFSLI